MHSTPQRSVPRPTATHLLVANPNTKRKRACQHTAISSTPSSRTLCSSFKHQVRDAPNVTSAQMTIQNLHSMRRRPYPLLSAHAASGACRCAAMSRAPESPPAAPRSRFFSQQLAVVVIPHVHHVGAAPAGARFDCVRERVVVDCNTCRPSCVRSVQLPSLQPGILAGNCSRRKLEPVQGLCCTAYSGSNGGL